MQDGDVGGVIREAMMLVVRLGGPLLGVALVVGVTMSLVQAVTQINEPALGFLPKLLAIGATLVLGGGFMFSSLHDFTQIMFDRIVVVGGH